MAVDDSFSLSFKRKSGKWGWSLSVCGLRLEVDDYYRAQRLLKQLTEDYPVVMLFNNTLNHVSEIHYGNVCEKLHDEVRDWRRWHG